MDPKLPKRDPNIEELVDTLSWVMRELRLCDELSLELFGISAAQLRLLCQLKQQDGMSVNELSEALYSHQSTVSELVSALTEAGLVMRADTADARRVQVHLTAKGKAAVRKANDVGRPLLSAALASLSRTKLSELGNTLSLLAGAMEAQRRKLDPG